MYTYTVPETNVLPPEAQKLYNELLSENHLLIGGVTGSGKSVLLNGLMYQAMHSLPGDVPGGKQFILIDPKQMELVDYQGLPHTLAYVNTTEAAVGVLESAVGTINSRNAPIVQNRKSGVQTDKTYHGSDIYILIDEMASLTLCDNRTVKNRIISAIQTIGQIGRAARVHLIACTQRPTQDVIPGKITVNIDARVGLRVRSAQESRNIIDQFNGCQDLPRWGFSYIHTPSLMAPEKVPIPKVDDSDILSCVRDWTRQKQAADAEAAMEAARLEAERIVTSPVEPRRETDRERRQRLLQQHIETYDWKGPDYDQVSREEQRRRATDELRRRTIILYGKDPNDSNAKSRRALYEAKMFWE